MGVPKGTRIGGRQAGTPNKATAELRKFAGKFSKEAVRSLVKIGRTSESDQAKVSAWKEVLDRYAGKAPQAITGDDGKPLFPVEGVMFAIQQQAGADNQT